MKKKLSRRQRQREREDKSLILERIFWVCQTARPADLHILASVLKLEIVDGESTADLRCRVYCKMAVSSIRTLIKIVDDVILANHILR